MTQNGDNKQDFLDMQQFYDRLFEDDDHYGVKKQWHGWAGNFHRYRLKLLKDIFVNTLGITKDTRILDIGCGKSLFAEIFTPDECPQVTAFDISTVNINKAKKNSPHIKFMVDDAQNPSLTGEWDILFAGEIIEHLPRPKEALKKWGDLLKKGGYLVISTPNGMFCGTNEEHIFLLTISDMKRELKVLNFEIIQIIGIDILIPFFDKFIKFLSKFPRISDSIYQMKMKLTFYIPWLAFNVFFIAKKHCNSPVH